MIICLIGCTTEKVQEEKKLNKEKVKEEIVEKELTKEDYINNNVDESGEVPIMMYHGIHNKTNDETSYIGGNVDKNG